MVRLASTCAGAVSVPACGGGRCVGGGAGGGGGGGARGGGGGGGRGVGGGGGVVRRVEAARTRGVAAASDRVREMGERQRAASAVQRTWMVVMAQVRRGRSWEWG